MERPAAVLEFRVLCGVAVTAGVGEFGMLESEATPDREPMDGPVAADEVLPRPSNAENGSLEAGA